MAAKTLKQAISIAFDKFEGQGLMGINQLKLRQDLVNEIRDFMAHKFSIYALRAEQFQLDPEKAKLVGEACVDLFDSIFAGIPALTNEKDKK